MTVLAKKKKQTSSGFIGHRFFFYKEFYVVLMKSMRRVNTKCCLPGHLNREVQRTRGTCWGRPSLRFLVMACFSALVLRCKKNNFVALLDV